MKKSGITDRVRPGIKATNDALHKRLGDILEQSNGSAAGQVAATETAPGYLVENTQLRNQIEAQEHTIAAQTVELETLKAYALYIIGLSCVKKVLNKPIKFEQGVNLS